MAQEKMLIKVDPKSNNNKFYHVILHDDETVEKRWGRVGNTGSTSKERTGKRGFTRIVEQKKRKGYKETQILSTSATAATINTQEVKKAAQVSLIKGTRSATLDNLIDTLVSNNRHEILQRSGGKITLDDSGQIRTPLGYITMESIREARTLLERIEKNNAYTNSQYLSDYLTLVPQKVPFRSGWHEKFFETYTSIPKQMNFLDQLEDSFKWANTELEAQQNKESEDSDTSKYDSLFRLQLQMLDDERVFSHVNDYFEREKNSKHQSYKFKLNQVFTLFDETKEDDFNSLKDSYGNVRELWHGTSSSNVLSILRGGLFLPQRSQVANGDMFGSSAGGSIYLSNQSTKSLNYSSGFWGGQGFSHDTCYMFLTDTVMGNEFRPDLEGFTQYDRRIGHYARTRKDKDGNPYNSLSVKGGTCGVRNNEMIIWNPDQVKLKFLCEFKKG